MVRLIILALLAIPLLLQAAPSERQLSKFLEKFPAADANKDGKLAYEEALEYRQGLIGKVPGTPQKGAPREFLVDPGWEKQGFPKDAACYKSPAELAEMVGTVKKFPSQEGILRVVGTGHSFMMPGYKALVPICRAAGFEQPLHLHTGGGITGSSRYKWEQENGIYQFKGKEPKPLLLASIANAKWEAMIWGPYFNDRSQYYSCWIDFCLKYNPGMKFYLSDAWPQLYQLGAKPASEAAITEEVMLRIGKEKREGYSSLVAKLRESCPDNVFILPTSDAMTLAAVLYIREGLPGIEGLHKALGGKERSLWRDTLGHLGPGFDRLEGYVFYATLYGKSPELIEGEVAFGGNKDFPSPELDAIFRKIAWEAVTGHPLSGIVDQDRDGVADKRD
jgi:hypothetical protein